MEILQTPQAVQTVQHSYSYWRAYAITYGMSEPLAHEFADNMICEQLLPNGPALPDISDLNDMQQLAIRAYRNQWEQVNLEPYAM